MAYYDNYLDRGPTNLRARIQERYYQRLFKKYDLMPSAGSKFLEIGPGAGMIARLVKDSGVDYFAVEQSEAITNHLTELGFDVKLGSCPPVPYPDDTFDTAFCSHVIEHLAGPQAAFSFVQELFRVLKPGGKLIIIAPDYMRMKRYFWDCDYTHSFPVTERRVMQIFRDCDCEVERISSITEPFAGKIKYLINFCLFFYNYSFLESIWPFKAGRSTIYKLRSTFSQSVLGVGRKPL